MFNLLNSINSRLAPIAPHCKAFALCTFAGCIALWVTLPFVIAAAAAQHGLTLQVFITYAAR